MSITVKDMLSFDNLNGFQVIAGHKGLNRRVTAMSVMDAPDIYQWVKGGEILMTTGYMFKDDISYLNLLIKKLNEAGASGIFIKLGRFIEELPEDVIKTADSLKFPVIKMPIEYCFRDVINPALSKILNHQEEMLKHSEEIHNSFTELVINGGNIDNIMETLKNILGKPTAFVDKMEDRVYGDKDIAFYDTHSHCCIYYPIKLNEKNYGYIVVKDNQELKEIDKIAIEHASTVLKLSIQNYISNKEIEKRYRDQFVQDLILSNIKYKEELEKRAKLYNWDLSGEFLSFIVDIDDFKLQYLSIISKEENDMIENIKNDIFTYSENFIKRVFPDSIYTDFSDAVVFLIKIRGMKELQLHSLLDQCTILKDNIHKRYNYTVTIGIGNIKSSIMEVYKSYNEAQKSIKLSRIVYKRDKVVTYDNLGVYKVLDKVYSTEEAKDFYKEYIEKICRHDENNNGELLSTLVCIMENNWNLKKTSEIMYVHYNTIKYRYKRIGEILDKDLEDFETKLSLEISIKLYLMNNS